MTVLWMARCDLKDLEGLGSLSALKELYLAFNQVTELDTISMLENLEILDLERYSFMYSQTVIKSRISIKLSISPSVQRSNRSRLKIIPWTTIQTRERRSSAKKNVVHWMKFNRDQGKSSSRFYQDSRSWMIFPWKWNIH